MKNKIEVGDLIIVINAEDNENGVFTEVNPIE
jgi:hypothetical protein